MIDFRAEPYVNMLGQTLLPGDEVVYAGSSWHQVRFNKGKYAGVYYGTSYWSTGHSLEVQALKIDNIPDKRYKWNSQTQDGQYVDVIRTAYLPRKRAFKLEKPLTIEHLNKMV